MDSVSFLVEFLGFLLEEFVRLLQFLVEPLVAFQKLREEAEFFLSFSENSLLVLFEIEKGGECSLADRLDISLSGLDLGV